MNKDNLGKVIDGMLIVGIGLITSAYLILEIDVITEKGKKAE